MNMTNAKWNKLEEEKCPNYKCSDTKKYSAFNNHSKLNYHKQIKQYICPDCQFGVYLPRFKEIINWKTNDKRTFAFNTVIMDITEGIDTSSNGTTIESYQKAKAKVPTE